MKTFVLWNGCKTTMVSIKYLKIIIKHGNA